MTKVNEHSDYYYDELKPTDVLLMSRPIGRKMIVDGVRVDVADALADPSYAMLRAPDPDPEPEVTVLAPIAGVGRWYYVPPPPYVSRHRSVGSALRAWANRPWRLRLRDVRPKPR